MKREQIDTAINDMPGLMDDIRIAWHEGDGPELLKAAKEMKALMDAATQELGYEKRPEGDAWLEEGGLAPHVAQREERAAAAALEAEEGGQ